MNFTASDTFNSVLYGNESYSYANTLLNNFSNNIAKIPTFVTEAAQNLFTKATNVVKHYASDKFIDFVNNYNTKIDKNLGHSNVIIAISLEEEFKKSSLMMQRWIMANPNIRQLYHDQKIDGYADTYVDANHECIGNSHYDYQLATTGMQDEDTGMFIEHYIDLQENDRLLTFNEKISIKHTWEMINSYMCKMEKGEDDLTNVF